jgi:type I restriction enzyme S subunit
LDDEIDNLYLNSFCFGFRITDSEVDGHFLAYFWRSCRGREIMTMLAQGSTRFNLSKSLFKESSILIPPTKKEQIAIVCVLSDMDSEISMLESRLTKYQSLKQGMMQQLLTGKTRLT